MRPIVLALLLALAVPAQAQLREDITVDTATAVLAQMTEFAERGIPPELLQRTQGIAIIPNVFKAGFLVGGRFGRGVVLVRDPSTGVWSPPVFLTLGGGSIGAQIGAQATDVVLVFRNRRGVDSFLMNRGKFTLGADASVAAGPVGRGFEAGTDAKLDFDYGLEIVRIVMAAYLSAERRAAVDLTDAATLDFLESYVPAIQQGRGAEVL